MPSIPQSLEDKYRSLRFPNLLIDDQMILPDYRGYSIANIPASVCNWLGLEHWPTQALDDSITKLFHKNFHQVILIVADGLGWKMLQKMNSTDSPENKRMQELQENRSLIPLTSIVPSTTSAALVSFWTGRCPSQHGITGYEMWLREYNMAANMINHSPALFDGLPGSLQYAGFNPGTFLPVETLGPFLTKNNVDTYVLQHSSIVRTGLSTMLFPQLKTIAFRGMQDMFVTLEEIASSPLSKNRYLYAYWGDLDELQHIYGPEDTRVAQEYQSFQKAFLNFIDHLRRPGRGDTLVLLTADHGLIPTEITPDHEVRRYPDFVSLLHMLPTGESRLPYLYVKPGCEEKVKEAVERYWPGQFIAISASQAVSTGLFGPGPYCGELFSRLGDLILLPRDGAYLYWQIKENRLKGRHGGLSDQEMLVPLFLCEC